MDVLIGIDPGAVSGAYAILTRRGRFICVDDIPVMNKMLDAKLFASQLDQFCAATTSAHVILEQVHAFSGQGVSSSFRFGVGYGIIQGICGAFDLSVSFVRPQVWKKDLKLDADEKKSLQLARDLYPEAQPYLKRVKDHNRGDAILIAHWALQNAG